MANDKPARKSNPTPIVYAAPIGQGRYGIFCDRITILDVTI